MLSYPLITLYTPGIKLELVTKAEKYNPDSIIIDLEDTVPPDLKTSVRRDVSELVPQLDNPPLIRVNNDQKYLEDDLKSTITSNTLGILLPKAESLENLATVDSIMTECERELGLEVNSVILILLIESALGVVRCFELSSFSPRIRSVAFGSAEDGDLQGDLGCSFSIDGPELMYARSRVLLEARAAGLPYVLDGAFSGIDDSEGFKRDSILSKRLGYDGRTLVHPSQINPARETYSISEEEAFYYKKVIREFEAATANGNASIKVDGKLIDYAMYNKAKSLVERFLLMSAG
ncbi:MAG: CoA ester lyase [Pseudomonadota bacterium]|nr:CoA ester lyase [Pseudomonadota bacterium]